MKFTNVNHCKKTHFTVTEPGRHIYYLHNFSGYVTVDIATKGAEVYIFGLYDGRNANEFNLHTTQHHMVGESTSDLFIKGVFDDQSKFLYEGLIHIDKGAQKSNAYQKNQNLITSDGVYVDSRPFLEIEANDVRCTHGSTTGKLDAEQLFYAEARGIDIIQAKEMLIEGFKQDLLNKMSDLGVDLSATQNI